MTFNNSQIWRVRFIFIVMVFLFGLLATRLYSLQVKEHSKFERKAINQQWTKIEMPAIRGTIYDCDMRVLSTSKMMKTVYVDTAKVENMDGLCTSLSMILGISHEMLYDRLVSRAGKLAIVKRKISEEEQAAVEALNLDCIYMEEEPKRFLPQGAIGAQITGLVDVDEKGLGGLEFSCDEWLKGTDGWKLLRHDGKGKLCSVGQYYKPPQDGLNVVTTINSLIQERVETHLSEACRKYTPSWAGCVVMDVKTGEVLAMVSYPNFDPNNVNNDTAKGLRLRSVVDGIPPGSTWKAFSYAMALENNILTPDTIYHGSNGVYRYRGRTIRDCHRYGDLTAEYALVKSSNICFAQIGLDMGPELLQKTAYMFGFTQKTGIEFPGEYPGYITSPDKWSYYTTTSVPFGQEMRVSVLQMAAAYSCIANGGTLMKPMLVKRVIDRDGNTVKEFQPQAVRRVISEETANIVKRGLRLVVEDGTAKNCRIKEYEISGKTGTAQMEHQAGGPDHTKYAGWFAGYAPANDPRICVLTVLVEPHGSYYGGTVAAPAVREIIKDALPLMGVAPEDN